MRAKRSNHMLNRRRHHRESMVCEVQVQTMNLSFQEPELGSHFCQSQDISASGVRLLAEHPYPVNTQVLMTLECKEQGWTRITSRVGSVVWSESESDHGQHQFGIQFTDADTDELSIGLDQAERWRP